MAALCALAWAAYRPGLAGGFLFDDFVNLPALGATGPVDNWPTFWRYITSGTADPTGRPLSLLSFLVDARDWPADPARFLRSNLLLHLLNGTLLFLLLRELGRRMDGAGPRTDASALLGAGLWLLHPLFVSTTLYIVQREAMLPATFVLLGLLAWLRGRGMLERAPVAGMAWMVGGVGLGTLLAVLCKANGILLPLFAWVLEATVLRRDEHGPGSRALRQLRASRWILLVLPSLVVFGYLASQLTGADAMLESRAWTQTQRLLTEPRVVLDYLHLLVVPRVLSTGLYNDAYPFSTGLLQPATTLLACGLLAALLALAFAVRRRAPALAAALLFFFAGHLLESTVIPLELYFEHRNYLPAMLLFWPLARVVVHSRMPPVVRVVIAAALLSIAAAITFQRADLWGRPEQMALHWARQNPQSSRAQATAAIFDIEQGRPQRALQHLRPLVQRQPWDLQLVLNHADAACATRGLDAADIGGVTSALRNATTGGQLIHGWLTKRLAHVTAGQGCTGVDLATIERWLAAARANPHLSALPGRQQDLHSLAGVVALHRRQPDRALVEFDQALRAWPTPQAAAMQAALLATDGHYRQALDHLDLYDVLARKPSSAGGWNMARLHAYVLDAQGYWPRELGILRGKLEADLANGTGSAPSPATGQHD